MKMAVIGSRGLTVTDEILRAHLPADTTVIISGGAKGVDTCAREYAQAHGIALTEFRPDYPRYQGGATHRRNQQILAEADLVLAFWDGRSPGTAGVIARCRDEGKACRVIRCD